MGVAGGCHCHIVFLARSGNIMVSVFPGAFFSLIVLLIGNVFFFATDLLFALATQFIILGFKIQFGLYDVKKTLPGE